jgi:hypothetical protein
MRDATELFNLESSQRHHTPELDRTLGATSSPSSKFRPNSKFQEETILKFSQIYTYRILRIFNEN